jgi:hypothetical protein
MAETLILKDGNNNPFNGRVHTYDDGTKAFYRASDVENVTGDAINMVGTTLSKFSDGFSGPTLAAGAATITSISDNWTVLRNTGGMAVQQTNGSLVIVTGTGVAEFMLVGKTQVSIPANLTAVMSVSARNSNQDTRIGYLEVDAAGNYVPNPNLANFPNNFCAVLFDGTSTSTMKLETLSGGHTSTQQVAVSSQNTSSGTIEYAIEARPEDIMYGQITANSTSSRSTAGARISTMVPSPQRRYAPFIWVRNIAATTTTTVTIQRIISMDIQELQAEIGGGRGTSMASSAVPIISVGTINSSMDQARGSTSSNNMQAPYRQVLPTGLNQSVVKSSPGKIYGGSITNTGTSNIFVKFYNRTTAPTVGTDPISYTLAILAGETVYIPDAFGVYGLYFSAGIAIATTLGLPDNDTTAIPGAVILVNLIYV